MNLPRMTLALGAYLSTCLMATNHLLAQTPNDGEPRDQQLSAHTKLVNHPARSSEAAQSMPVNHHRFACDMYQQLGKEQGNLFFSPSSIWTALAMCYVGAAGTTAEEMSKTLLIESLEELQSSYAAVESAWQVPEGSQDIQLRIANRLWGQESFRFLPSFISETRDQFDAELKLLNFANSDQARTTINRWVEEQTEDKIKELLPDGVIDASTMLVLTNAVYFKGSWTHPFIADSTQQADFNLTKSTTVKVPLMYQLGQFAYKTEDELQILELRYGDGQLSMVILLPKMVDGLKQLESQFNADNLERWTQGLKSQKVNVYLPKFKSTSQFELNDVLKSMGMPSAFDASKADFSGMSGNRELFLSAVIHKAFVDVNEEGTEAAAATGAVFSRTSVSPQQPAVFRADRPFIYLIRDVKSGAVLFLGRMSDPTQ